MNEVLKSLLIDIRQHPGFPELLKTVEAPQLPRYRLSQGKDLERLGADFVYRSGQLDQHERWLLLLKGTEGT